MDFISLRPRKIALPKLSWNVGWFMGLGSASLFVFCSLIAVAVGSLPPIVHGLNGLLFAITALAAASVMILRGGGLASIAYFLVGTGVFFGFGAFFSVVDTNSSVYMNTSQQTIQLPKVNLVNSVSIFIITAISLAFCYDRNDEFDDDTGLKSIVSTMKKGMPIILVLGYICHSVEWLTFPWVTDPIMMSVNGFLMLVPLFAIFMGGICMHLLSRPEKILVLALAGLYAFEGLLTFMKITTLMPFLTLGIGLWIGRHYRIGALLTFGVMCVGYFGVLWFMIPLARGHVNFDMLNNTVVERVDILSDTVDMVPELHQHMDDYSAFSRLSIAQFSAHFIENYDQGMPGDTLEHAMIVVIPRVLWPEKPIIDEGRDIDTAWRDYYEDSNLGIGFPAEAYWNNGWAGVIFVSIYMGIMMGWFTRRWFKFQKHGWPYLGVFLCGAIIVKIAIWVETAIVGAFIGGWIKIAFLVLVLDLIARLVIAMIDRLKGQDEIAYELGPLPPGKPSW